MISENPDEEVNESKSASMFGWSVTSAISKFYPSKSGPTSSTSSGATPSSTTAPVSASSPVEDASEDEFHDVEEFNSQEEQPTSSAQGWDDGWGSEEDVEDEPTPSSPPVATGDGWEEEEEDVVPTPASPVRTPTARTTVTASGWDDGWGDDEEPDMAADDGWGGADESWDDFDVPTSKPSKMEMAKERKKNKG